MDTSPLGRSKKFKEKGSGRSGDRLVLSHLAQIGGPVTHLL